MSTIDSPARAELRAALVDIAPAMIAAVPIGLLYGSLAVARGLAPMEVVLMSALVFAGGAQFAAVEMWDHPVPVWGLVLSTFLINARHVLMGASLASKLGRLSAFQRFLGCAVLADENWALAERRARTTKLSARYVLGMGAVFWANWVIWSGVGTVLGPVIGDPRSVGADFAFAAIFIGLVVSLSTTRCGFASVAASAIIAALVHRFAGSPWHVLSGSLAGIAIAALFRRDANALR